MIQRIIDVHGHFIPRSFVAQIKKNATRLNIEILEQQKGVVFNLGNNFVRRTFPELSESEQYDKAQNRLSEIGLTDQILSIWLEIAGYHLKNEAATTLSRIYNECLGEFTKGRRGKLQLAGLATLPMQDPVSCVRELEYALDACGLNGAMIGTNVCGKSLDDVGLESFWEAAESLGCPIFIHPANPITNERLDKYWFSNLLSYPFDTTIAAMALICGGVLDRYPKLKIVLAHGGGYLCGCIGRVNMGKSVCRLFDAEMFCSQDPLQYLGNFYFDTLVYSTEMLEYLRSVVGSSQLLIGTDFPFPVMDFSAIDSIKLSETLSSEDKNRMLHKNAVEIFSLPETF
ncbi:MAG: amidohydrolase family protein [Candidatus Binatia bacterium]